MRQFIRGLSLDHVKDYVQIGVGLSFISGGIITVAALFSGGDSPPATAVAPTETATITASPATEAPSPKAVSTSAATTATGEFLRVQFGTEQDPISLLPTGDTVGPNEDIEVCPGDALFAWVEHTFSEGDVINGRLTSRTGALYSDSVPVDENAPNFWIAAEVSNTGIHTLAVRLTDDSVSADWNVNVTCSA